MTGLETVFASLPQFLLVCLILAAAEAVYVLLGFGAGLVAVGSLALLLPELRDAVVLLLLVNLPAELYVVRTSWARISWRGVMVLFAGVAIGIPIGAWLLRWSDPRFLLTVLGVLLIVVGTIFLISPKPHRREHHPLLAPPVGFSLRPPHRPLRHRRTAAHPLLPAYRHGQNRLPGKPHGHLPAHDCGAGSLIRRLRVSSPHRGCCRHWR